MNISIKTDKTNPLTKVTFITDGKNTLSITEKKKKAGFETITSLQSNGDSIYPVMDLLKIWEATR